MLNRLGGEGVECTDSALDVLMRYGWPGNIRELRNVITRALSLCQNGRITVADLPPELRHQAVAADSGGTGSRLQSVVHTSEAQTILTALHEQKWNVARTARTLGCRAPPSTRRCASSVSAAAGIFRKQIVKKVFFCKMTCFSNMLTRHVRIARRFPQKRIPT